MISRRKPLTGKTFSSIFLCVLTNFCFLCISLEIFEKLKAKKPKLDIEKAVNREIGQKGTSEVKSRGSEKKSKTQLKKTVGKKKHKGGKNMDVNKGGKGKGRKVAK